MISCIVACFLHSDTDHDEVAVQLPGIMPIRSNSSDRYHINDTTMSDVLKRNKFMIIVSPHQ